MKTEKPQIYHVKPAEKDLKVPNPETEAHLPPEGTNVVWNSYWQRRLDAKEVVKSDAQAEKTDHKKAAKVDGEHKTKESGGN